MFYCLVCPSTKTSVTASNVMQWHQHNIKQQIYQTTLLSEVGYRMQRIPADLRIRSIIYCHNSVEATQWLNVVGLIHRIGEASWPAAVQQRASLT